MTHEHLADGLLQMPAEFQFFTLLAALVGVMLARYLYKFFKQTMRMSYKILKLGVVTGIVVMAILKVYGV